MLCEGFQSLCSGFLLGRVQGLPLFRDAVQLLGQHQHSVLELLHLCTLGAQLCLLLQSAQSTASPVLMPPPVLLHAGAQAESRGAA